MGNPRHINSWDLPAPKEPMVVLPTPKWLTREKWPEATTEGWFISFILWYQGQIWHRQVPMCDPLTAHERLCRTELRRRRGALPAVVLTMLRASQLERREDTYGMFDLWHCPSSRRKPPCNFGAAYVTMNDLYSTGVWPDDQYDDYDIIDGSGAMPKVS